MVIMISVIIPIYNVLPYVEKCVRSVMNQRYRDLEILLIDDGSDDGSGLICDTLAEEDARIRILHTENRGLSAARNLGCRESKGEYIYYLDGDDRLEEDCLPVLFNALLESEADMCVGGCHKVNSEGTVIDNACIKTDLTVTPEEYLSNYFGRVSGYLINSWNKLMKRSVAEKVIFPEGMNYEDRATFARLIASSGKIRMVSQPTYIYSLRRPGSITATYSMKNLEDYLKSSEILANDMERFFPGSSCVRSFLERRNLEDLFYAWKYVVMYLESLKGTEPSELKQQLLSLKDQYTTGIRQSKKINKIPRFRARVLLRLIQGCPRFAEYLYVSRENWKSRKIHG